MTMSKDCVGASTLVSPTPSVVAGAAQAVASPTNLVETSPLLIPASATPATLNSPANTDNGEMNHDSEETKTLGPGCVPSCSRDKAEMVHGECLKLPNSFNGRPGLSRTKSVLSLQAINDSVDRIVKDIKLRIEDYKGGRREHKLPDQSYINQIYYSVFKSPSDLRDPFLMPPEGCAATGPVSQAQFDSIVDSVVEAMEEGVSPKLISQGSSGSYFMYDPLGKVVGVFKPKDEEPYGPLSPKWTKWLHRNLFPCFFGRPCLVPNNGYICEAGASLLDRQLQTHIVPFTDVVYLSSPSFFYRFFDRRRYYVGGKALPNKVGSFQLFLHGYEQADLFFKRHPLPDAPRRGSWTPTYGSMGITTPPAADSTTCTEPVFEWTEEVLQQFREELEKLVILDYIMRNTDRGLDNWMIRVEWETIGVPDVDAAGSAAPNPVQATTRSKKVPRIKIGAIDSGLAFPWKHPDEWRSYPFGWLFMPLSVIGKPFSQKTRDHFLPMLCSQTWWEDSAIAFKQLFSEDSEFSNRLWKKQWAVMKGQAFNVVETLKCPEQGPLELVRRTRVMVFDDEMDVPVHIPYPANSMDAPVWNQPSSLQSFRDDDSIMSYHDNEQEQRHYKFQRPQIYQYNPEDDDTTTTTNRRLRTPVCAASRNKSADARLMVPKRPKRHQDSSMSLVARYRALESSENLKANQGFGKSRNLNLFEELVRTASPHNQEAIRAASGGSVENQEQLSSDADADRHTISCSEELHASRAARLSQMNPRTLINNVGFSFVDGFQATRKVIVERLQTVTSKPPVFTWC